MNNYRAPFWLPGGHTQTIWSSFVARSVADVPPRYRRERWDTPDGDFIDVDFQDAPGAQTLLVLFHGLEGSSHGHYARAFAGWARKQGLAYAVPHFRGCSGEINRAPRAYHSGDWQEIDWILKRLRAQHAGRILAVGISLGGNALLRWAGEMGASASQIVDAAAAVCSPLDLAPGGHAIGRGLNRLFYTPYFLRTMKPKAQAKWDQFPGLFDLDAALRARTLYEFDHVFTAPLHGFKGVDDYWSRASAKPHLADIRIPALALNARNDPFIPAYSLPRAQEVGTHVTLWQPAHGGHVGFAQGKPPGNLFDLPRSVGGWLLEHAHG